MLLLGLLVLCATAAFTGLLIADNLSGGPEYSVVMFGNTIATMNSLEIFLSGLALALIFCFALAMAGAGTAMARRRRALLRAVHPGRGKRAAHAHEAPAPVAEEERVAHAEVSEASPEGDTTVMPGDAATTGAPLRARRHLFGH